MRKKVTWKQQGNVTMKLSYIESNNTILLEMTICWRTLKAMCDYKNQLLNYDFKWLIEAETGYLYVSWQFNLCCTRPGFAWIQNIIALLFWGVQIFQPSVPACGWALETISHIYCGWLFNIGRIFVHWTAWLYWQVSARESLSWIFRFSMEELHPWFCGRVTWHQAAVGFY